MADNIIFFIVFYITFIFCYLYGRLQLNIKGYEDRNIDIRRRLSRNKRHNQRSLQNSDKSLWHGGLWNS